MMKTIVLTLAAASATSAAVDAKVVGPDCHAIMLAPIKDDLNNDWAKGKILPVDIARTTPTGGAFCAHGGSCLPRKIKGREAVRLTDCKIGPSIGEGDYRLVAASRGRKR